MPEPPNPPDQHSDENTQMQYEQSMLVYKHQVDELTHSYELQLTSYRLQSEIYRSQLAVYEQELEKWVTRRIEAVSQVENEIANLKDKIGWAFVVKKDPVAYRAALNSVWLAQVLQFLLFLALLTLRLKSLRSSSGP